MGERNSAYLYAGLGGVDLFFALSGFLITGILLQTRWERTYFSSFYARRSLRIFPIYYLFLIVTMVAAHLSSDLQMYLPATRLQKASYFMYLQNWPVFWQNWEVGGMGALWGVFWSLAVEEQFYLVWPTIVRLLSSKTLLWVCFTGFLLGWPARWLMFHHYGPTFGIMQTSLTRLDGLLLGAAIAVYRVHYGRPIPLRWAASAGALGTAIYLWVAITHRQELYGAGVHMWRSYVTAFALVSGCVLVLIEHKVEAAQRCLSWLPLVAAGRISYGMYVYHLPVFFAMGWMWKHKFASHLSQELQPLWALLYVGLAFAIVAVVASLSYRWIETPALKLKRFFPSRSPVV